MAVEVTGWFTGAHAQGNEKVESPPVSIALLHARVALFPSVLGETVCDHGFRPGVGVVTVAAAGRVKPRVKAAAANPDLLETDIDAWRGGQRPSGC
nr:hypothetical protein Iba_scaffold15672CG0030 [Ipomoea batatas]